MGVTARLRVMWKSHILKWRVQKQQEKSKEPQSFKRFSLCSGIEEAGKTAITRSRETTGMMYIVPSLLLYVTIKVYKQQIYSDSNKK